MLPRVRGKLQCRQRQRCGDGDGDGTASVLQNHETTKPRKYDAPNHAMPPNSGASRIQNNVLDGSAISVPLRKQKYCFDKLGVVRLSVVG